MVQFLLLSLCFGIPLLTFFISCGQYLGSVSQDRAQTHLSFAEPNLFQDKFFVTFAKTNEDNHPDDYKIEDNLEL